MASLSPEKTASTETATQPGCRLREKMRVHQSHGTEQMFMFMQTLNPSGHMRTVPSRKSEKSILSDVPLESGIYQGTADPSVQ